MKTRETTKSKAAIREPRSETDGLDEMTLGALQARFAEVVSEKTRSPNKVYLQRRMREAMSAAAQAEATAAQTGDGPAGPAPDGPGGANRLLQSNRRRRSSSPGSGASVVRHGQERWLAGQHWLHRIGQNFHCPYPAQQP